MLSQVAEPVVRNGSTIAACSVAEFVNCKLGVRSTRLTDCLETLQFARVWILGL
jgi:hypothetical protein